MSMNLMIIIKSQQKDPPKSQFIENSRVGFHFAEEQNHWLLRSLSQVHQFISNFHFSVCKIFLFLILFYFISSRNQFQFPVGFRPDPSKSPNSTLNFLLFLVFYRVFLDWCWRWWAWGLEGGSNCVKKKKKMRLFPLSSSSSSSMDNERRDGVQKSRALLYLNVYDLTPVNNYLYWFGLGVFHSGVEGNWLSHCTTFVFLSLILKLIISN